jgi:antirestriction protein
MPRIYIASLSDYNAGRLVGKWVDIDATTTEEDLYEAVAAVLATSLEPGAEEFAIHDFDGFPAGLVGEYEPLERVAAYGRFLAEDDGGERFAFLDVYSGAADDLEDAFSEAYLGAYDSVLEYAESYVEDTGLLASVPEDVQRYFDYTAFARDLELGGDIYAVRLPDYRVAVFANY